MKRLMSLLLTFALVASAQLPTAPVQRVYGYDTNSNLIYICESPQGSVATTWSVAGSTLTSIAVSSNVGTITFASAPGLYADAVIVVSGSSTSALNATYKITATSGSTATITTSGVSNGTYTAGLVVSTNNPLLTAANWKIQINTFDTSNRLVGSHMAQGTANYSGVCSNATSY